MAQPDGVPVITADEAAQRLGVDYRTVRRWLEDAHTRARLLPGSKRDGRAWAIPVTVVEHLVTGKLKGADEARTAAVLTRGLHAWISQQQEVLVDDLMARAAAVAAGNTKTWDDDVAALRETLARVDELHVISRLAVQLAGTAYRAAVARRAT